MGVLQKIESEQHRRDKSFRPGDQVRVHVRIVEGDKERVQVFEGVVIGIRGGGSRASFTVRKVSYGVGVERVFPLHSPSIDKIEVVTSGKVRRAKLYYLRQRRGKAARLKERDRYSVLQMPEPAAKQTEEGEPAVEKMQEAEPAAGQTEEAEPAAGQTEEAEPAAEPDAKA